MGKEIETLVPSGSQAAHREYRAGYLHNPESRPMGVGRNLLAVRKDGSEFPIEVLLYPIRLEGETSVLFGGRFDGPEKSRRAIPKNGART